LGSPSVWGTTNGKGGGGRFHTCQKIAYLIDGSFRAASSAVNQQPEYSKKVGKAHGGEISVETKEGEKEFIIQIPGRCKSL
jgi:hypothetical protein